MIKTLQIKNFRCFDDFEMTGLARVNLLVGTNNSGKTSILEALELWASRGHRSVLLAGMERRGEFRSQDWRRGGVDFAMRHLFHGHSLAHGQHALILGHEEDAQRSVEITVEHKPGVDEQEQFELWETRQTRFEYEEDEEDEAAAMLDRPLVVVIHCTDKPAPSESRPAIIPLSATGYVRYPLSRELPPPKSSDRVVCFVTTRSLSAARVSEMFGEVVLTEEEGLITTTLKSIEPAIERIATLPMSGRQGERGGIVVKCAGQKERIPIGSMGDGIWRILSLALALVNARGGILLVDEIDTGLHFTVMNSMWKLITQTAQRLDVQVFATSHSRDCYESLASVLRDGQTGGATVAIHRLEREKKRSVVFDEEEIVIAASRNIEVR